MARQLAAAVGVLGVIGVVFLLFWDRTTTQPLVTFDAEPVSCEGTEVRLEEDDDGFRKHVIELRPEMECRLRFFVSNPGSDSITIERIELPFLGPDAGSGAIARALNPTYNSAEPMSQSLNAGWAVSDTVQGGERISYEALVVHDANDCQSAGGVISMELPVVTFSDGAVVSGPTGFIGFGGVGFNEC